MVSAAWTASRAAVAVAFSETSERTSGITFCGRIICFGSSSWTSWLRPIALAVVNMSATSMLPLFSSSAISSGES